MALSQQTTNAIWGRSGGRCYLDRSEEVVRSRSGNLPIGEIAHIVAENPSGPRGDEELSKEARNSVDNLILLCPTHHAEIDKYPEIWSMERLLRIKEEHEVWVRQSLDAKAAPATSSEISVTVDFESCDSSDKNNPRFLFSLKNTGAGDAVVHAVDAEILALAVQPSKRAQEIRFATMALIPRTPVSFDFSGTSPGELVHSKEEATGLAGFFRRVWGLKAFEIAIHLTPGEIQPFTASIMAGSFAMGTFRLVATYWEHPSFHQRAVSSSIGFFSVPDHEHWPIWPKEHLDDQPESSILDFQGLLANALGERRFERPIWADDVSSRAELFQRTLGRIEEPRARAVIEDWLRTAAPERYIAALEAIDAAPNSDWKSAMTERALSSHLEAVRASAVSILGDFEYSEAFETLAIKALTDSSPVVRRRALARLRYETNERISSERDKLINDPDPEIRSLASKIIADLKRQKKRLSRRTRK